MDVSTIGAFTIVLGFATLFAQPKFGICVLIISTLFGSAAAVSLPGLGGVQPTHLLLGFLFLRALADPEAYDAVLRQARFGSTGWWLLLTLLFGIFATYFLPRYFAGSVLVNPIRAEGLKEGVGELPLVPTPGNITQLVYFTADVMCFFLVAAFAERRSNALAVGSFLLAYCGANVLLAFADFVCSRTGTSYLLDFMRNASYAIFDDVAGPNIYRLKGSFTEASAFAYATVGALCYTTRLYLAGIRPRLSGCLALLSLIFLCLSTSSTGYVALLPCFAMLFAGALWRALCGKASQQDAIFIILCPLAAIAGVLFILMTPVLRLQIYDLLDSLVLNKSLSQSGLDRTALNISGLRAFTATYGLGTGIGSVRASSFIVAIAANLGLIGSMLYCAFLARVVVPRDEDEPPLLARLRSAARCGIIGSLIAASISGALIDLGLAFFAMAALSSTPVAPRTKPAALLVGLADRV